MPEIVNVSMKKRRGGLGRLDGIAAACGSLAALLAAMIIGSSRAEAGGSSSRAVQDVDEGRYLATGANCVGCHTVPGGQPFTGGVAFKTPFGTIYSTNITPDNDTGIGRWSKEQFVRAMRYGIRANGENLYPAFPYTSFTKISDRDLDAIWAFLSSIPPVSAKALSNEMRFPFGQRKLMTIWNALFFEQGRYIPDLKHSAEWNRGAYLVQGLGHCGACHTPRNFLGAEKEDLALTGGTFIESVQEGVLRSWSGTNLTTAPTGLGHWSVEDLKRFLKTGHSSRAGSFGPMNAVINATRHLTGEDIGAIAEYLMTLPPKVQTTKKVPQDKVQAGELVYTVRCGSCHLPTGLGDASTGPPLVGSAVVQAPDPASLINSILYGAQVPSPVAPGAWKSMRGFATELNDDEVAALCNYLRGSWGNQAGTVTAAQVAKQR